MYELALFSGAGGGILGGLLNRWRTVAAVEINPYRREILIQRQRDGILAPFPIWDDVRTFTSRNNACRRFIRGLRSIRNELVISGGFPCQDISAAGRGAGIRAGSRSGLWREYSRIVGEIRPAFVFAENSPLLVSRGLDIVIADFASLGYDVRWCVLGAWHVCAPHMRNRIWILAYPKGYGQRAGLCEGESGRFWRGRPCDGACPTGDAADAAEERLEGHRDSTAKPGEIPRQGYVRAKACEVCYSEKIGRYTRRTEPTGFVGESSIAGSGWWASEPAVDRMAYGVADRVDRIEAIGDGQVPIVAAVVWRILSKGLIMENSEQKGGGK